MAKASERRIVIPNTGSASDNLKLDDNGNMLELSRNLGGALKTDSGSELTPRSRVSWAHEVEEEHEATGWKGKPRAKVNAQNGAKTEDVSVKKTKKKKKKKSKGGAATDETPTPTVDSGSKPENHASPELEAKDDEAAESEICSDLAHLKLEIPNSPAKMFGANGHGNIDRDSNKGAEVVSSPHGRSKASNQSQNAVWVTRNSEDHKTVASPKDKVSSGSSWQPVGVKDIFNGQGDVESLLSGARSEFPDSGWEVAGSQKDRRGEETVGGPTAALGAASYVYVPPPPSNGTWDDDLPLTDVPAPNWDATGWEVAGSRRNKRGDDIYSHRSSGLPNLGPRSRGRGQQLGPKFTDQGQRGGNKQRPGEWEKVPRGGRSGGNNGQDKGGRGGFRNSGWGEGGNNVASPRPPPSQSAWGKPINKLTHSSSNLSSSSFTSGSGVANNSKSSILGKLFPAERGLPELEAEPEFPIFNGQSLDDWKGGFPAFGGNGSSVFDDYPGSLYSDSQCSDEDLDSDTMSLASFDSAESHKSHGTQKRNKWFRIFFQDLDDLTEDQLQEHDRQWHCPACQGGVGAIDWYRGLQPLLAHAKTVRSKRVKLHKAFAEVLEEEVRIRGAAPGTHGSGKYGKWRGLGDDHDNKDTLIVWPPMVVIRNTQLEQDEVDKWIGMGNKELLDMFKKHNPVKARHAYGPQGHRGISILIFPESPTGYYDAQRLDKHFKDARRGKENWNSQGKVLFQPGGDRILYGYIASPEDLDIFNKHSKGKQNLKWEKKSLQEMVLSPMRKMDVEMNKVVYLEGQVQREMEASKTLKKTMSLMMKRLHMREDELKVIRERAREQYKQQELEMEDMEMLYKSKIEQLKQDLLDKEAGLQKVHEDYEQEHLEQCEQLEQWALNIPKDKKLSDELQQQQTLMEEEIARHSQLVEMCIKRQEDWEARKVDLLKEHHQKMMEFKSRQWQDLIAFEENLDKERMTIMEAFKLPAANEQSPSGIASKGM